MKLINKLNDEQKILLKEAGVKVENKQYTEDECNAITHKVIDYIMNFSKNDIGIIANKYEVVLDKIIN